MFYTYILKSLKNVRCYIGSTNNINRRINEHNTGISKYTRATRPFILLHKEEYQTRKEAVKRELFLKTGVGRDWIKNHFK